MKMFTFIFAANIEDPGHGDWDVEQAQAEVHWDDQQRQQLFKRVHPSDPTKCDQPKLN